MDQLQLATRPSLIVRQRHELVELFGFETRNKYEILDANGQAIAFAAEQQKGILGFLLRSLLGHWRRFEIHVFNNQRQLLYRALHPFRFFFQRLEVYDDQNRMLGVIQQRFAILTKKFSVLSPQGKEVMSVSSPFWKLWTFPFVVRGREVATVRKKWSGSLTELFTDKDNFLIEYKDPQLAAGERALVLLAGLFVDLQYFEHKAD